MFFITVAKNTVHILGSTNVFKVYLKIANSFLFVNALKLKTSNENV